MVRCEICNVEVSNWEAHIKSKLHKKLLEKFGQIMDSGITDEKIIEEKLKDYRDELKKDGC